MFEPQRLPMRAKEFKIARRRILAEISARAVQLRETTGRAAFDERVSQRWEGSRGTNV
jgi:hypothetical protein